MLLHDVAYVDNDAHHFHWSLRFHEIPLPQTGSIAPGLLQSTEDRRCIGAHLPGQCGT